MPVQPIPPGFHTVTPYLIIRGAGQALEFYQKAFGAEVAMKLDMPGGRIGHAEIRIGDSPIMLADECPEFGNKSPQALNGSPVGICLYVRDVDAVFNRAVGAGATIMRPLTNQFYGDRSGTVVDPYGHQWTIATHIEDVSGEEIGRRMKEMAAKMGQKQA